MINTSIVFERAVHIQCLKEEKFFFFFFSYDQNTDEQPSVVVGCPRHGADRSIGPMAGTYGQKALTTLFPDVLIKRRNITTRNQRFY